MDERVSLGVRRSVLSPSPNSLEGKHGNDDGNSVKEKEKLIGLNKKLVVNVKAELLRNTVRLVLTAMGPWKPSLSSTLRKMPRMMIMAEEIVIPTRTILMPRPPGSVVAS